MSDHEHLRGLPKSVRQANASLADDRRALAKPILTGDKGIAVAHRLSDLTDRWIQALIQRAFDDAIAPALGVYPIGGYGRRELAYHSDIDLLIFVADDAILDDPRLRTSVELLMKWTREAGLRLRHAVRTPAQLDDILHHDLASATALLDLRTLQSPEDGLCSPSRQEAIAVLRQSDQGRHFASSLLGEYQQRVRRNGRTVYLLEPHIKTGEGGLRDLQSLRWARTVCHRPPSSNGPFYDLDDPSIDADLDALFALRHRLHWCFDRAQERLGFREQRALTALDDDSFQPDQPDDLDAYRDQIQTFADAPPRRDNHQAIESLMADYYRRARAISARTARLLRWFSTDPDAPHRRQGPFIIGVGQLALADDVSLDDDLIFDALQVAADQELLLSPPLADAIRLHVQTWPSGDALPRSIRLRFFSMLTDPRARPITSDRLLRMGIVSALIPEFQPLICHVQHDLYHVYTTDIHSLKCLEEGRQLIDPSADPAWPFFAEVARHIDDAPIFLLACLLHDIGKNRGGGHSEKGAQLIDAIAPRLELSDAQTRRLTLLVRHHLLLSNTSRRRDISDPQVIDDIAAIVERPQFLYLLTSLTYCDTITVGPEVMNDWKASLLTRLHRAVESRLLSESRPSSDAIFRLFIDQTQAPRAVIDAFLSTLDDHTLAAVDNDDLRRYFQTYLTALDAPEQLAITARPLPDRSVTEVVVCSPDRPGILSDIAGAIASLGINIMAADILTVDHMALDIFHIAHFNPRAIPPTPPRPVDTPHRLDQITARIRQVLQGDFDVDAKLQRLLHQSQLPPRPMPTTTTDVQYLPDTSDDYTVIEVRAPDRLGLLYSITDTLRQSGVDTRISRIDSLGHQAIDTFYLCTSEGAPLADERIDALTKELLAIL